jgi:hypothetical protein
MTTGGRSEVITDIPDVSPRLYEKDLEGHVNGSFCVQALFLGDLPFNI